MSEVKDNIKKCVDHLMSKDKETQKRLITALFEWNDTLINEQLFVKALNDDDKQKWWESDVALTCIELQQRIDKAIEYIKEKYDYILKDDTFLGHDERIERKQILKILDILKGADKK